MTDKYYPPEYRKADQYAKLAEYYDDEITNLFEQIRDYTNLKLKGKHEIIQREVRINLIDEFMEKKETNEKR